MFPSEKNSWCFLVRWKLKIFEALWMLSASTFIHSRLGSYIHTYIHPSFIKKSILVHPYIHPFIQVNVIAVHSYTHTVYLNDSSFVQTRLVHSILILFILRSFKTKPSHAPHTFHSSVSSSILYQHSSSLQSLHSWRISAPQFISSYSIYIKNLCDSSRPLFAYQIRFFNSRDTD